MVLLHMIFLIGYKVIMNSIKTSIVSVLLGVLMAPLYAGGVTQTYIGIKNQNNFYNQQGVQFDITDARVFDHHLVGNISYTTNRLFKKEGALTKDHYTVGMTWEFRPSAVLNPYIQLELGRSIYKIENSQFNFLDNKETLITFFIGSHLNVYKRINIYGNMGYSFKQTATIDPLFLSIGIRYRLSPKGALSKNTQSEQFSTSQRVQ
jgi:hypothetical protein